MIGNKHTAKLHLQIALWLARDLQLFYDGDTTHFDRMVGGRGNQILNPVEAQAIINRACSIAQSEFPVTCRSLSRWLECLPGL